MGIFKQNTNYPATITDVKTLGLLIKSRRKNLRLTQAQLAGVSGVGVRFISDLENGKPTIEIAKALQVIQHLGLVVHLIKKTWDNNN